MKTAIFSGRFDTPTGPHIGHVLTIKELVRMHGKVIVVVLDYEDRQGCTADESVEALWRIFYEEKDVLVVKNEIHFGKITVAEYRSFLNKWGLTLDTSIYVSGNLEVVRHFVDDLQIPCEAVPRSGNWEGTKDREAFKAHPEMYNEI